MTDARFPEQWLNDRRILRLDDDAFRLFVISLTWSVANRTDGRICDDDLALIPASTAGIGQLATSGLWERAGDYWFITVYEDTQTTRDELDTLAKARRAQRDKKRRQRAARAARASAVPGTVPATVPGDVTRDVPQDSTRTGQDRTGSNGDRAFARRPWAAS
jgi:hypothetical protein